MLKNLKNVGFNRIKYPALAGLTVNQIGLVETGPSKWRGDVKTVFHTGRWAWERYTLPGDLHEHFKALLPEFVEYEYLEFKWLVPQPLRFKEVYLYANKYVTASRAVFHGVPGDFFFGKFDLRDAEAAVDRFLEHRRITRAEIEEIVHPDNNRGLLGEDKV